MVDRSGSSILVVIFVKFVWSCSICGVAIGHRGTMSAFTNSSSAVWRRRVHFNNHYLVTFKSTVPGWNLGLVFINTMRTGWRPRQVKLPLRPRQRIFSLSNHNKWRLKTKWRVVFFFASSLKVHWSMFSHCFLACRCGNQTPPCCSWPWSNVDKMFGFFPCWPRSFSNSLDSIRQCWGS